MEPNAPKNNEIAMEEFITHFVVWSSFLIYYLTWFFMPILIAGPEYWHAGAIVGSAYVGGHIFELRYRGHCNLCADSTAIPAAIVAAFIYALILYVMGMWSKGLLLSLISLGAAVIAGHMLAIGYCCLAFTILEKIMPRKTHE